MFDRPRPPTRDTSLEARVNRVLDPAVLAAALLTIPLLLVEQSAPDDPALAVGNWSIWGVFVADFVIRVAVARDRAAAVRRHALSLAIVVLSFPPMPELLSVVALGRLVQLLRLLRSAAMIGRGLLALRPILGRRATVRVLISTVVVVVAGGLLLSVLEPETVKGDALTGIWWAAVTASTVGYGDVFPTTLGGRILAVALMMAGIGLISTLSASIAAYFVEQDESDGIAQLEARLDRIEKLLERLVEPRRPE